MQWLVRRSRRNGSRGCAIGKATRRSDGAEMARNRETTGDSAGNPCSLAKPRPENICEFSCLRGQRHEIPYATEQGINSSITGNRLATNRELIRPNRELVK